MLFRFAALALLLTSGTAWAGDKPLYAPAPAWVKAAPPLNVASLTDEDSILLLLDQQQKLEKGQAWTYADTVMRIATAQVLAQAGTIKLPWNPDHGDLTIHSAEILRGDTRIDLLADGKTPFSVLQREEKLEQGWLDGTLTATLSVEGLRVGDVLHVAYSVSRADPALGDRVQLVAPLLAEPVPLRYGRVRVIWPDGLPVVWKAHVQKDAFTLGEEGGYKVLSADMPLHKLAEMPGDAPQRFRPLPLLEATSFASWRDVADTMAPLYAVGGSFAAGTPLAREAAKIAAASDDPRTRAAMALRLVQDEIRYLYKGMEGGNYVPQQPEQTWALRYGDCKAKSLLLVALLRALGIDAEPALVSSTLGELLPDRVPMPGAFDHVIARATIGGETLWLDGTAMGARFADLGDVPPFAYALPLHVGSDALVPMPRKAPAQPEVGVVSEIDQRAGLDLPAPFRLRMAFRGATAELLRTTAQMGKTQRDSAIDALAGQYLSSPQLDARALSYDAESGSVIVTASGVTYPDWTKEDGRYRLALDRALDDIDFTPDRSNRGWADIPVAAGALGRAHYVTRLQLPGGGEGFAVDGDETLPPMLATSQLSRKVARAGDVLTIEDDVVGGMREVASEDIPAERGRVAQAKARLLKAVAPSEYPPRWKQVEAARKSHALDRLLAVYDKGIEDAPDEADPYFKRAWFLERIFDRAGAVRDLGKAIALEPSQQYFSKRSYLRESLGDDKGALEDAQAALKTSPGDLQATSRVATLLGRLGKVDEALAMIDAGLATAGKDRNDWISVRATLLADHGRAEEGVAALDAAVDRTPGDPDLLNIRCWLKGTANLQLDSALKDCTKAIALSETSAHVLDSRGLVWLRMGRMEDALADLNAAIDQRSEQAESLFLRAVVLRRMGGAENAKAAEADLAAARILSPRIAEQYQRWGIAP